MRYDAKIKALARQMFVDEGRSIDFIADFFRGQPSRATIANWANRRDSQGQTWHDYRQELAQNIYTQLSPQGVANTLYERLQEIIQQRNLDPGKFADAVNKLVASMNSVLDTKHQIAVIFQVLEEILEYAKTHHAAAEPQQKLFLADVLAGYRDQVKERL